MCAYFNTSSAEIIDGIEIPISVEITPEELSSAGMCVDGMVEPICIEKMMPASQLLDTIGKEFCEKYFALTEK